MQFNDKLFLFYTGNVRDENWVRHPYQIGALLNKEGKVEKMDKVLIEQPKEATDHFRDPQIFNYKGQSYAIVGGQTLDKKGFIKLYKAVENDYINWEEVGDLECPNLVFIDETPILLYCPQGLSKEVAPYDNIFPNMYKIGQSFDTAKTAIVDPSPLQNLDYGFDCYATQAFNAPDGRVLAVSWLGLPDIAYPSDRFDHQGIFSLVKELTLKKGKLYQYPVQAIQNLRKENKVFTNQAKTKNSYELELEFASDSQTEIVLFADQKQKGLRIRFDIKHGQVTIDRSEVGEQYALEFGTVRRCMIENQTTTASIFIDKSVFEIFINKGEKVFSGRIFPHNDQNGICITEGNPTGTYYELDYGRKVN